MTDNMIDEKDLDQVAGGAGKSDQLVKCPYCGKKTLRRVYSEGTTVKQGMCYSKGCKAYNVVVPY